MKAFAGLYIALGILLTPFVYLNNGGNSVHTRAYAIGRSFANSIMFWPSYVFAWEPEINGDTDEKFSNSIAKIDKWRQEKWFTANEPYTPLMLNAIGLCILADLGSLSPRGSRQDAYRKYFNSDSDNYLDPEMVAFRMKIRDRFDGMDYSNILSEGNDCMAKIRS